ncbi:hypothetical protein N8I77_009565 [Diaporthe amygdali]|uniref:Uncharacterized protein n=1 Tax=Phomopsis amygdali TaxID=1214568 RepID=A0AAD9W3A6_PHOAM|nr:hypothetical protein N8I77_009565 [Diaporthe amygdali]
MAQSPVQDVALGDYASAQALTQTAQTAVHPSPRPHRPHGPSLAPSQSPKVCKRCRKRLWDERLDMAVKIIGILAFLLSCAALCPSICGQEDAHRATQLAEWSALKDFLEYCESIGAAVTVLLSGIRLCLLLLMAMVIFGGTLAASSGLSILQIT